MTSQAPTSPQTSPEPDDDRHSANLHLPLKVSVYSGINNVSDAQLVYWALGEYKLKQLKYLLSDHLSAVKQGDGDFSEAAAIWGEIVALEELQTDIATQSIELAERNYLAHEKSASFQEYTRMLKRREKAEAERHEEYLREFKIAIK